MTNRSLAGTTPELQKLYDRYGGDPATPAVGGEPVAWLVPSSETGLCRIWWREKEHAEAWVTKHPDCTLVPLYAAQPASPLRGRELILEQTSAVAPAVENLACHQEQCDIDGVMVKVSRQALDEVLGAVEAINTIVAAPPEQPAAAQEALRLLRKISDLAYDADVGEPLDCAIDYANKAIAVLTGSIE